MLSPQRPGWPQHCAPPSRPARTGCSTIRSPLGWRVRRARNSSTSSACATVRSFRCVPRYFDDTITETVAGGIRQIVVVAAGMDTRAYRLGLPDDTVLFELDRPNLLRLKGELLGAAMPSGTREPIGVDLATNFTVPLVDAGFRADRPTCWLVEGLTQYLTESDVHRMIDRISSHSAIGSHLLIDFIGTSLLESPAMSPMLDRLAERSMTWQYGTDEPETLLEHRGWRATVTRIGTVGTAMNRWPFPDAPRGTPCVPQGYLVHATA
jgi:methyltransferase (TIGR00027 family)